MKEKTRLGDTVKIFLVEDHPIFRKGLAQLIEHNPGFEVVGEAEDAVEALAGIRKAVPDIVIVDISLKGTSGMDLLKDIRLYFPSMKVLMLSMHDENLYAERALRAGAMGYLMKEEAPETVITALNHILAGKVFVSENISSRMLSRLVDGKAGTGDSPVDVLSDRELQVFQLIGQGASTREIAQGLHVSIKTVENHRAHIKEKLGLKSSLELVQQAALWIQKS